MSMKVIEKEAMRGCFPFSNRCLLEYYQYENVNSHLFLKKSAFCGFLHALSSPKLFSCSVFLELFSYSQGMNIFVLSVMSHTWKPTTKSTRVCMPVSSLKSALLIWKNTLLPTVVFTGMNKPLLLRMLSMTKLAR